MYSQEFKDKIAKKWMSGSKIKTHRLSHSGTCPSEHDEQCALVRWLTLGGYKFTSIPNAGKRTYYQQSINKQEGLNSGLPDMLIIINNQLVWIELKRIDKKPKRAGSSGGVSDVQKEWIEALNGCANCQAFVCYGAEEAKAIIQSVDNSSI